MISFDKTLREDAKKALRDSALDVLMKQGGVEASFEVLEESEIAVSYLPGNFTRLELKVLNQLSPHLIQGCV